MPETQILCVRSTFNTVSSTKLFHFSFQMANVTTYCKSILHVPLSRYANPAFRFLKYLKSEIAKQIYNV